MAMFAYLRRLPAIVRFAGSTALTAVTLTALAGVTPGLSADYYGYGRYGEQPAEYPPQVYPQPSDVYERPREYRVIVYPVRRGEYFYEGEPNGYRAPRYSPGAYPSRYNGPPLYGPDGYGAYGQVDRDGRAFEDGVPLPPEPVGPRRAPVVYAPPYTWQ